MVFYILLKLSETLILQRRPAYHSVPESKKLEIRFRRDGEPTEVLTNHNLQKIYDHNSTQIKVNGVNPYDERDNIDPYTMAFDKVYAAKQSGLLPTTAKENNPEIFEPTSITNNQEIVTQPQFVDENVQTEVVLPEQPVQISQDIPSIQGMHQVEFTGKIEGTPLDVNQFFNSGVSEYNSLGSYDSNNDLNSPDELADHLQMTIDGKPLDTPVMLSPKMVQLIINYLNDVENTKNQGETQNGPVDETTEEIAKLNESAAILSDRLVALHDRIEQLKIEIERLKSENDLIEAELLEKQKIELEEQEYKLQLELEKQEDIEMRQELSNLEHEKEDMVKANASDEQLATIDGEIGSLQEDIANIDEQIKIDEINHLMNETEKLEDEKLALAQEMQNDAHISVEQQDNIEGNFANDTEVNNEINTSEKIQEIEQEEDALLAEAMEIAENTQIETELEVDIDTLTSEEKVLEDSNSNFQELQQIKRIRRKLEDLKTQIETEDHNLIAEVQDEKSKVEASNSNITEIQSSQEDPNSQGIPNVDPNLVQIGVDGSTSLVNEQAPGFSDTLNLDTQVSFRHIPYMLDLLRKISVSYKSIFINLPEKVEDVPPNSPEYTEKFIEIFKQLEQFYSTFELMKSALLFEYDELKDRVDRINTEIEGILEFYELAGQMRLIRNEPQIPSEAYLIKLEDINLKTQMIGERVKQISKSLESLKDLEVWLEEEILPIKAQVERPDGPGIIEISSIVASLTPKLINAREDVKIVTDELKKEFQMVADRREQIALLVNELDILSGHVKPESPPVVIEKEFNAPFILLTRGREKLLTDPDYYWNSNDHHGQNMEAIQQHLEKKYNLDEGSYVKITSVAIGLLFCLII